MNNQILFDKIIRDWESKLHFLNDKPEENIESTIKALWFRAAGIAVSAQKACNLSLPNLTSKQIDYLHQLIEMRINNTPLSYITGRQNFMGIDLLSDRRALIPRKETELLGKKALELSEDMTDSNKKIHVMDICCGSGNLGIAVAYYNSNCIVHASDISLEAVGLAQENINLLNLNEHVYVKQGDMMSAFEKDEYYDKFDLVICNPPYISSSKVPEMDLEISLNEPALAFDGGMFGINIIQKLINEGPKFLTNKGWLVFEVGAGQGKLVKQLCERTQLFSQIESVMDDSGHIRVILAQKS